MEVDVEVKEAEMGDLWGVPPSKRGGGFYPLLKWGGGFYPLLKFAYSLIKFKFVIVRRTSNVTSLISSACVCECCVCVCLCVCACVCVCVCGYVCVLCARLLTLKCVHEHTTTCTFLYALIACGRLFFHLHGVLGHWH